MKPPMRIATYNANSIRSRLDTILKWLTAHQPDILAIQETKVQDADFPLAVFLESGYEVVFRGQKKYNGVAILSQSKPEDVVSILPQDTGNQARFLKARIDNIVLINTYIPQGMAVDSEKFQYKLNWFDWLGQHLRAHHTPEETIVWVGDFNIAKEDT